MPAFPSLTGSAQDAHSTRYAVARRTLEAARPSLLVVVATDHLNAFFIDEVPAFALHVGDSVWGPVDEVPGIPLRPLPVDAAAARSLGEALVSGGHDALLCRERGVDHSVMVPVHFLNPMELPVVVLIVNAYVAPLPAARRCFELGATLGRAIGDLAGRRVAIVASGVFSQEVGGPRVDAGRSWSVPRPDWATRVSSAFGSGEVEALVRAATPSMLADAGSVAGELLTWIVMAGAMRSADGPMTARLDHCPGEAFAYGTWSRA